jgi:hypothetical protein
VQLLKKSKNLRDTGMINFFACALLHFTSNAVSSKLNFLEKKKKVSKAGKIPVERHGSKTASNIHSVLLFINNP